jgi:murein DD-endopeptidase MepM/ murein hydrolase activator NlpD
MTTVLTIGHSAELLVDVLAAQSLNVSVVFLVVLLATGLLRRRGPAMHLALWSMVFVRLVLPPNLAHPWSLGALADRLDPSPPIVSPHANAGSGFDFFPIAWEAGSYSDRPIRNTRTASFALLWLLGATTALAAYWRRLRPFHTVIRAAQPLSEMGVLVIAERWRHRLRVRRRVRIVTSSARRVPFTIGIVRPVIFLPTPIATDVRSVEPVIAHEMAHVARWDALWLGVQQLVQALYFFHPLVWIAGARLDMERERLCDATVVAAGRLTARDYVGGLLNVLELDLQGAGAPTMTSPKRRIDVRVRNILEQDGGARPRLAAAVAAVVIFGVFVLPLGRGAASAGDSAEPGTPQGVVQTASEAVVASFENPIPGGRVTWAWGPGHDPWNGNEVFHRGIDLAAKAGTPVLAPADGVVAVATEDFVESPSSGTVIVVDHGDGWSTFYAHLESLDVTEGQQVQRNDVIATVGSTGKSTGPHLHFEIHRDGERLNPADFVGEWR